MSIVSPRREPSPEVKNPEPLESHAHLIPLLKRVIDVCLHGLVFLVPLFFSTLTLDAIELNKQTVLVLIACVAAVAWTGQALLERKFTIVQSWIHVVTVLFGVGYLLVALASQDRYLSFVGSAGQMPWAFGTIAALIVLYIVVVNHVRSVSQVYDLVLSFLASSFLVAVFGLLQMSGIYLFGAEEVRVNSFTTVGGVFSLAVFLTIPVIVAASLLFHGCRNKRCVLGSEKPTGIAARVTVWLSLIAGLLVLLIVDFWVAWAALLFGTALTLVIGWLRSRNIKHPFTLAVPTLLIAMSVLFLIVKTPIDLGIPPEVSPSALASWNIARQTLEETPLFGSGPGTWIYNYAKYRVPLVNQSPFWNIRFDRGFSYALTLLATSGLVGAVLWVMLVVSGIVKSARHLVEEKDDDVWYAYLIIFSGWATLVFLTFFYNLNMAHVVALWFLFALLGSLVGKTTLTWNAQKSPYTYGALSTAFVILVVAGVSLSWLAGQRYVADAYFSKAVRAFRAGESIETVLPAVQRAASLNPLSDLYARNLSQAYLVQAATKLQSERPNQQDINVSIGNAVEGALAATEVAPANVDNWANLGIIYESIVSRVAGANEAAIRALEEAVAREPQNPVFPTEIGKIYLFSADSYAKAAGEAKEQPKIEEANQKREENLNHAETVLKRAIELKPDYLPARYYLGIVHERKENLAEAIAELENVLRLDNKDVGVAFELSILYYRNNQKDQSLNLLEQIVQKFEPNNANAKWYLAAMYEERGRYDDAIRELEGLAEMYPENEAIQQRLNAMKAARDSAAPPSEGLPLPIEDSVTSPQDENPLQR